MSASRPPVKTQTPSSTGTTSQILGNLSDFTPGEFKLAQEAAVFVDPIIAYADAAIEQKTEICHNAIASDVMGFLKLYESVNPTQITSKEKIDELLSSATRISAALIDQVKKSRELLALPLKTETEFLALYDKHISGNVQEETLETRRVCLESIRQAKSLSMRIAKGVDILERIKPRLLDMLVNLNSIAEKQNLAKAALSEAPSPAYSSTMRSMR